MVAVVERAIAITPVDFTVTCGLRTKAEQRALYAKGRTEPGPKVTWTLNSRHLKQQTGYGHAVDIAALVKGKISWKWKFYYPIAKAFKQAAKEQGVRLVWLGDTGREAAHFEIRL